MRRLLFVTYHFPPSLGGGIPRITSFTRDLPAHGWLPSVLTSTVAGKAAIDSAALAQLPADITVTRAYCPIAARGLRGQARTEAGAAGARRRLAKTVSKLAMVPDP